MTTKTTSRQKAIVDIIVMLIKQGLTEPSGETIINDFADPLRGNLLTDKPVADYLDDMLVNDTARARFIGNVQRGLKHGLLSPHFYDISLLGLDVIISLATHGFVDRFGNVEFYHHDRLLADYEMEIGNELWAAARINIDEWVSDAKVLAEANAIDGFDTYIHGAKKPANWVDVTANIYHKLDGNLLAKLASCDSCSVGLPTGEIILYENGRATAYIPQSIDGSAYGAAYAYTRTFAHDEYFKFAGRNTVHRETFERRPHADVYLLGRFIEYLLDYGQIEVDEEGDTLSPESMYIIRTLYRLKLWRIDVGLALHNVKQTNHALSTWDEAGDKPFPAVLKQAETGITPNDIVLTVRLPRLHSGELGELSLNSLYRRLLQWGIVDNSADLVFWDATLIDTLLGRELIEKGDIWVSMISTDKKQDVRLNMLQTTDEEGLNEWRQKFTFGFAYALALKHNYSTTRLVNANSREALDLLEAIIYTESLERECLVMRQIYNRIVMQDSNILNMTFTDALGQAARLTNDYEPVGVWQTMILDMLGNAPAQVAGQTQSDHIDEIINIAAWDLAKACNFNLEGIKGKSQNIIQRTIKTGLDVAAAKHHLKSWHKENATGKLQIAKGVKSRAMMMKQNKPRPTHYEDYAEAVHALQDVK